MSSYLDWERIIRDARFAAELDDGEPVPRAEVIKQLQAEGYEEREAKEMFQDCDEIAMANSDISNPKVVYSGKTQDGGDEPDTTENAQTNGEQTDETQQDDETETIEQGEDDRYYPPTLRQRDWWVDWVLAYPLDDGGEPETEAVATKQPIAPYRRGDAEPVLWNFGLSDEEHPSTDFATVKRWEGVETTLEIPAPDRVISDEVGVGVIIPPEQDETITLLDWDDVRNPETGELHPVAAEAIEEIDGYAEISQSGKGVHQFVFGEIPGGLKKFIRYIDDEPFVDGERPQIEMYESGRLCAMTGRKIDGSGDDVVEGQDLIDELCWKFGTADNASPGTPTDPFAWKRDDADEPETPSHREVDKAVRDSHEYSGDDPDEWDIPRDWSIEYAAVLRARERSDELSGIANWELIGYAAGFGYDLGLAQDDVLADLKDHPTPQYGYDKQRAQKEVRSVYRKAENGNYEPPTTRRLVERGILPDSVECDKSRSEIDTHLDSVPELSGVELSGGYEEDAARKLCAWYEGYLEREDENPSKGEKTQAAADFIEETEEFVAVRETDELWHYRPEEGIWYDDGEKRIRTIIDEGLKDGYTDAVVRDTADRIRSRTALPRENFELPERHIPVKNGLLNAETQEIEPLEPEHHAKFKLNVRYDPEANAPRFDEYIKESTRSGSARKKLQEYAGYILLHNEMPHHKAMFMAGPKASGKSTFIDTISDILADEVRGASTPQQLTRQFGRACLKDRWLNVSADIPSEMIENLGPWKMITGDDKIEAEVKNVQEKLRFKPSTKHIFSANQLPNVYEADDAFWRRILIVAFPESVPREERDGNLKDKLAEERPGILNWMLDGLERLLENGKFTADLVEDQTRQKWEMWGTSVVRWKARRTEDDMDSGIPKSEAYDDYRRWCADNDFRPITMQSFGGTLKEYPYIGDTTVKRDGHDKNAYSGIEFAAGVGGDG